LGDDTVEQRSIFYLNEYVSIGDIIIRVTGVEDTQSDEFFGPKEGNKYVSANV
jgi:hypothetical protein